MRRLCLALGLASLSVCPGLALAQNLLPRAAIEAGARAEIPEGVRPLTLAEAWRIAEASNPTLQSASANQSALDGASVDARSFLWNNPQLTAEGVRRDVPAAEAGEEWHREWGVGISQAFEIAGQQALRRDIADMDVAAFRATVDETRRQVRAEVEQRFVRVLALQERVAIETLAAQSMANSGAIVGKRVAAGEDSRLDGNLAAVEVDRQRNVLASQRDLLLEARAELATALQLEPGRLPEAVGDLSPRASQYTLDALLASTANRPQLRALEQREQSARSRLALERALVYPDITVGIGVGREGANNAREKLVGLNVSIPLPLFRRNGTGIGKATSELTQAQIEQQSAKRDVPAQVRALWLRVQSLRERVKRNEESTLARVDENQRLSRRSYEVGEIGVTQLLVVNRQVLDAQRDLLEARAELRLAIVSLEAAAGWEGTRASR